MFCKKNQQIILVDEQDRELGIQEKIAAHEQAQCHRAFSVFIYHRRAGQLELLLQQRQHNKYHCGGLWTNTCCSHPQPGEDTQAAAERRLNEEMGIQASLTYAGKFHYIAHFDNGLTENEVDHVFIGPYLGSLRINTIEVSDYRWISMDILRQEIAQSPQQFTPWLLPALDIACKKMNSLI